jgi:hypothetical protein
MNNVRALLVGFLFVTPGFAQVIVPAPSEAGRPQIDVESYAVEAILNPAEGELTGTTEIRFVQLDRQNYAVFDLDHRLRVRDVYLGEEEPVPARFRQFDLDSTLEVDLSDLGQFDQPFIRVEYAGLLDPENEYDPVLSRVLLDSAFLLEESRWFPMNGVHQDPALLDLHVTLPADWEVVSPLSETGFELADPIRRTVRRALVSETSGHWGTLVAGMYESSTFAAIDGTSIETIVFPRSQDATPAMSEASAEYFRFFRDTFGEPVDPTFQIIEIEGANWDSRSIPGMILLPASAFNADFDPFELAQHVAKQWFPVTYSVEDPVADAWLAEGLGVFSSLRYFENTLSPADADDYVERTLVKALSYPNGLPLIEVGSLSPDSSEYSALAAFKGGFVFRMLSDVMSEDAFENMLAAFPTTFADRPLSTRALLEVSSDAAGDDLTFFFDQWLNSSGVPEFTRDFVVYRRPDGYEVMGQIEQDLDLFRMPIEIEVDTDGESEYKEIWVSGPSSEMDLLTERKPEGIVIDPRMKLLRVSPEIRVKVNISRGEDLADQGRFNDAIQEYQAAVDEDRLNSLAFFRMGEAYFELGNLQLAANLFRESLNGDLDPIWIEVWAYINIGKIYDIRRDRERALAEYQKALNTRDDAFGAQTEAQQFVEEPFRGSGQVVF